MSDIAVSLMMCGYDVYDAITLADRLDAIGHTEDEMENVLYRYLELHRRPTKEYDRHGKLIVK